MEQTYEAVCHVTNMEKLSKDFSLLMLVNPSPITYRKFVKLEVANPFQPDPRLRCAGCLFQLGFSYARLTRHLKLKQSKNWVADWIQWRVRKLELSKPKRAPAKPAYIPKYSPEEKLSRATSKLSQKRAKMRLRSYFSQWLNRGLYPKLMTLIVGCDLRQFHHWMECQFKRGMTWENHGAKWQIDHILPCNAFDLTNRTEVLKCFHFTNLRPLVSKENNFKRAKVSPTQIELTMNYSSPRRVKKWKIFTEHSR